MNIRFTKSTYTSEAIPLFYTSVKNFSPATVLNITDVSNYIPENNPIYNAYIKLESKTDDDGEYILPPKFQLLPTGNLLITDQATESKYVDHAIPLYYAYELMYDHYSPESTYPEGFITIRKNGETTISTDAYRVDTRENLVVSGRYSSDNTGGFQWSSQPVSGNVITARVLLPMRETDDSFYTVEYNRNMNTGVTNYWSELIDEQPMYLEDLDYVITPSSITIPYSNTRIVSGNAIYVQIDPASFVKLRTPTYTSDLYKTKRWEFGISTGGFRGLSGVLNNGGLNFYCESDINVTSIPNEDEQGVVLPPNILRVSHYPMITPSSNAPRPGYVFTDVIPNLFINGQQANSKIKSVDATRGFIMMDKNLNTSDKVTVDYNHDNSKLMVVRNLDLNPMFTTTGSFIDIAASGLGIAIVPSGTVFYDSTPATKTWSNIALYNLADNPYGDFTTPVVGWGASALDMDTLGNDLASGVIPSGSKFLGSITVNMSPEEHLDIVDVRRTGGYDADDIVGYAGNYTQWRGYSDIGFWDGEALPLAGTVIIQIPSVVHANITEIFNNNDNLQVEPTQYPEDLAKVIDQDVSENFSKEQIVTKAVNKYIRDTIEKYLPAGTLYLVVDENMEPWPSIRGDF